MKKRYRCIVLSEPFAALVLWKLKTIEIRSWKTNHRGPVVVSAGKALWNPDRKGWPIAPEGTMEEALKLPRGVARCIVNVTDCRPSTVFDTARACFIPPKDSYAWELAGAREVPPVPIRGNQGMFWVEFDLGEAA